MPTWNQRVINNSDCNNNNNNHGNTAVLCLVLSGEVKMLMTFTLLPKNTYYGGGVDVF